MKKFSLSPTFFLAQRFLRASHTEKTLGTMVALCFASIALSSCALTLIAAIMQGFDNATYTTLQGVQPDLIITSAQPLRFNTITHALKNDFTEITGTSAYRFGTALVSSHDTFKPCAVSSLIALNPIDEASVTKLEQRIIAPKNATLATCLDNNRIIIGEQLAQELGVWQGQPITLFYSETTDDDDQESFSFEKSTLTIGGILKTGIDDFDSRTIIMDHNLFLEFFEIPITAIGIGLKKNSDVKSLQQKIEHRLESLTITAWYQLYPSLVSALHLQKYAMFLILVLISLIASINNAALLYNFITYKRTIIALLATHGMSTTAITRVFMYIGLLLTIPALICGLAGAGVISFFLEHYKLISLPDVYYIDHVPAHFSLSIVVITASIILATSILATWFSTRRIRTLSIPRILSGGAE